MKVKRSIAKLSLVYFKKQAINIYPFNRTKKIETDMQNVKHGKITSGTKEWADSNVNFIDGCSHDCKYCYAKKMAIRFNRKTNESWKNMNIRQKDARKGYSKRRGRVMFPTSHDLFPEEPFFSVSMLILEKLLIADNDVLITTKPHLEVIKNIVTNFKKYERQIQFRFTITSISDDVLKKWEPGAPLFNERRNSLLIAYKSGFKTSLSIEPCLDADPRPLIENVRSFVTESIWLGSMNYYGHHDFNSLETLKLWMKWFNNDPLVRFKDSILNKINKN